MTEDETPKPLEETLLEEKQKEELGLSLNDLSESYATNQHDETYINAELFSDFKKKMKIIWKIVYTKDKKYFNNCPDDSCLIIRFNTKCETYTEQTDKYNYNDDNAAEKFINTGGITISEFINKMYILNKDYIEDFLKEKFNFVTSIKQNLTKNFL